MEHQRLVVEKMLISGLEISQKSTLCDFERTGAEIKSSVVSTHLSFPRLDNVVSVQYGSSEELKNKFQSLRQI